VSDDLRARELTQHLAEEVRERHVLLVGEVLLRCFALRSASAGHADADGLVVVVFDVRADVGDRPAFFDHAITADHEVVADAEPLPLRCQRSIIAASTFIVAGVSEQWTTRYFTAWPFKRAPML
jgi:hypothetical protein